MKIELILRQNLVATHSLDTNETPHEHLFKLEFAFTGDPIRGRIIDLPTLERGLEEFLAPYQKRNLNQYAGLPAYAREFPTCETLGQAFYEKMSEAFLPKFHAMNPTFRVVSILLTLCDPDGKEYGSARIVPS